MKRKYDKWDWLMLIATLFIGTALIYSQPPGSLYHFIPLITFWIIQIVRNFKYGKKVERENKKDA